jgi:hypothetical protein
MIAVPIVRVMQMALHQVVHMIPVRYRFMTATRPMRVPLLMPGTFVPARAVRRISRIDGNPVLVDMVAVHVVQVPVMHIADMPVVLNGRMAAAFSVHMAVPLVNAMTLHASNPLKLPAYRHDCFFSRAASSTQRLRISYPRSPGAYRRPP